MILETTAGILVAVFVLRLLRLLPALLLVVAEMAFSPSASAAGVDSRAYTCDGLHALVTANRFVFINYPSFMDFVVANSSVCSSGEILGLRSVPTSDTPRVPRELLQETPIDNKLTFLDARRNSASPQNQAPRRARQRAGTGCRPTPATLPRLMTRWRRRRRRWCGSRLPGPLRGLICGRNGY